jgi:drug/metabolite transporter (DMT)-like permease
LLNLIGSIVFTSYLILSFKAVERFRIPVLQAIVFNYVFCVITGSVVNGSFPIDSDTPGQPWFLWAVLMGIIFFTLFNFIGFTTQKIGVAVASVANKLSLVIPFVASLYLYNEESTALKIAGIVVALIAVFFTCLPSRRGETAAHRYLSPALLIGLPVTIFMGSGLLDTMIKYVEHHYINETNNNAYLITAFAAAATVGLLTLAFLLVTKRQWFDPRSIVAGLAIGVPNYFSIWCLLRVLKQYPDNSSAIIPINNMGIVLFSAVAAWFLFKERLTIINWMGIGLAWGAIALIAFG